MFNKCKEREEVPNERANKQGRIVRILGFLKELVGYFGFVRDKAKETLIYNCYASLSTTLAILHSSDERELRPPK